MDDFYRPKGEEKEKKMFFFLTLRGQFSQSSSISGIMGNFLEYFP